MGQMKVFLSGDALITRRFRHSTDPGMLGLIELIRSADVRFTNLEMLLNDYQGTPAVEAGGLHLTTERAVGADLLWAGFNLFANANNHSLDFGTDGLRHHVAAMKQLEMAYAGVGETLDEAARPAYVDTAAGRAAMISCASSFAHSQRAGEARGDFIGRPGLNSQRYDTKLIVDDARFEQLREIAEAMGFEKMRRWAMDIGFVKPLDDEENQLAFGPDQWRRGPIWERGEQPAIRTTPHERDLERNVRNIQTARRQADLVIMSIHAHEADIDVDKPATFLPEWAHACIDAGADIVTGSGPHMMRGIEIYKGKPIFYSLGNLWFEFETVNYLPADSYEMHKLDPLTLTPADVYDQSPLAAFQNDGRYWECTLPVCTFSNGELVEIKLHPVTLGYQQPRSRRGTPRLAEPDDATRILDYVSELSKPFGTEVVTRGGIGDVVLS
jgi:poly-gamma-glutamate synthesis protein (capsule biosynthesis protein)